MMSEHSAATKTAQAVMPMRRRAIGCAGCDVEGSEFLSLLSSGAVRATEPDA